MAYITYILYGYQNELEGKNNYHIRQSLFITKGAEGFFVFFKVCQGYVYLVFYVKLQVTCPNLQRG